MIQNWLVVDVTQAVSFSVTSTSCVCHLLPTAQQRQKINRESIPGTPVVNPSRGSSSSEGVKLSSTEQMRHPLPYCLGCCLVCGREEDARP